MKRNAVSDSFGMRNSLALAGAFFLVFAALGTSANGVTVFFVPVCRDLGFSQSEFSLTTTLISVPAIFLGPVVGDFWSRKFGSFRTFVLAFGVPYALTLCLQSTFTALWQFYLMALIRGMLVSFTHVTLASIIINRWFPRRCGTMNSIAMIGSSLGGLFFTQVCSRTIASLGWQAGYIVAGGVDLVLFIFVALAVRPIPGPGDLRGVDALSAEEAAGGAAAAQRRNYKLKELLHTKEFWMVAFAYLVGTIPVMGIQQCITTSLELERGFDGAFAATCYSVFTAAAIVGKPVVGRIYDKFGLVKGLSYATVLVILSCVCLMCSADPVVAVVGCILFGLGNMASTVSSIIIVQDLFGPEDYGRIYGFLTAILNLSAALGMPVSSVIYDSTGSYNGAWVLYIIFNAVYLALIISVKRRLSKA